MSLCQTPIFAPQTFPYDEQDHHTLPHVINFSGGRSSGLMLFSLLESGVLQQSRGDVILFCNTSAEHPATYKFVSQCQSLVESEYGIPFFWLEFQTYESLSQGHYRRLPSYRLVHSTP